MWKDTERQLDESWQNIKPYLNNIAKTQPDLYAMCEHCPHYCGVDHNFEQCLQKFCFKGFLALHYLEWCNGWR